MALANHYDICDTPAMPATACRTHSRSRSAAERSKRISRNRMQKCREVVREGFELDDVTGSENADLRESLDRRAAESGAVGAQSASGDADDSTSCDANLLTVIEAWPKLSPLTKNAILGLIRGAGLVCEGANAKP